MKAAAQTLGIACLLLGLSAPSVTQASDENRHMLGIFETACFPSIDTLDVVKKRIVAAGWARADLGANPQLDQAVGNFLTAPGALVQTISVDSFARQDGSQTYFLIYRRSQSQTDGMQQSINSCHVYDFAAQSGWNAQDFEVWRDNALLKYKYLNIRGAFYTSQTEPEKRPKDGKLLTGYHFTASNLSP
jgi:hypothetical protein